MAVDIFPSGTLSNEHSRTVPRLSSDVTKLLLPDDLCETLNTMSIKTAEELLSCLHMCPYILEEPLGRNSEQVAAFGLLLGQLLTELVHEEFIHPGPPVRFAHGGLSAPGDRV
ncbi:MAG: hypothetical protein JWM56_170 [Candidatus Peribacteria bacterium]|nr:hypothetical protein [Candidatus Peribacteria bacterium]